ncbi:hypothetical protein [Streptomyces sp. NPDC021622]|uniref:hypothetical protein n=1 Tax=Streptomyces sp. NPDC021622 TaxID=3155013 RepID=UPI0033FF271D
MRTDPADTRERAGFPAGVRLEFTAGGARGAAWWPPDGRALRADPADQDRLPADTWERTGLPAGAPRIQRARCTMKEFTRGAASWPPNGGALRANPTDRDRLPANTREQAGLPAGTRLEFTTHGAR